MRFTDWAAASHLRDLAEQNRYRETGQRLSASNNKKPQTE